MTICRHFVVTFETFNKTFWEGVKKELIVNAVEKIGEVYKQIKKNEQSPNTEYLFNNLEQVSNFEKSIRKLEMMESMDVVPKLNLVKEKRCKKRRRKIKPIRSENIINTIYPK